MNLLLSALLAGLVTQSTPAIPQAGSPLSLARSNHASLAGAYFGVTTTDIGDLADFLRLEAGGSGALYDGLRWIRICEWNAQADGRFSFATAEMFGRVFTFEGSVIWSAPGDHIITGVIDGRTTSTDQVVFHALDDEDTAEHILGKLAGLYSSVQYVEEAGDNVGAELFLGTSGRRIRLALAFAEGVMMAPFVGRDVSVSADTVRFRVGPPGADESVVTGVFTERGFDLHFRGRDQATVEHLRKAHSLTGFFQSEPFGECPSRKP